MKKLRNIKPGARKKVRRDAAAELEKKEFALKKTQQLSKIHFSELQKHNKKK